MGKTLETKKEILSKLKDEKKTVTQLSGELGLSKATVSQHLSELKSMGAVEEDDNSHFRRLKYFKLRDEGGRLQPSLARIVTVVAVAAALGVVYAALALGGAFGRPGAVVGSQPGNATSLSVTLPQATSGPGTATAAACPMLQYYRTANRTVVGKIVGEIANGSPCYLSYINVTSRMIGVGAGVAYNSSNGTLTVPSLNYTYSINASQTGRLEAPNQKYCWQYTALDVFGINATRPENCRPGIYT